jgi:hypothetical protein
MIVDTTPVGATHASDTDEIQRSALVAINRTASDTDAAFHDGRRVRTVSS